jgi:hypothetical protein
MQSTKPKKKKEKKKKQNPKKRKRKEKKGIWLLQRKSARVRTTVLPKGT